jgi:hypothetical protein
MNCYIGIKFCGCVTCAILDYGDTDEIHNTIIEWKKKGMSVELVDVEEARNRLKACKCQKVLK